MTRRGRRVSAEERALWDQVARTAVARRQLLHRPEPIGEQSLAEDPTPALTDGGRKAAAPRKSAGAARVASETRASGPERPGAEALAALVALDFKGKGPQPAPKPGRITPKIDKGILRSLSRGRSAPEARIDLHGMTLAEARPTLTGFLLGARARGARLVLVITGKGRVSSRSPHDPHGPRSGALKREVPHWLRMAPLADLVLESATSHLRHGGEGALYVYLRKPGKGRG